MCHNDDPELALTQFKQSRPQYWFSLALPLRYCAQLCCHSFWEKRKDKCCVVWGPLTEMAPVTAAKHHEAFVKYKHCPCRQNLNGLRNDCFCAHKYWLKLCERIQHYADTGDVRGMHEDIKKAVIPSNSKAAFWQLLFNAAFPRFWRLCWGYLLAHARLLANSKLFINPVRLWSKTKVRKIHIR